MEQDDREVRLSSPRFDGGSLRVREGELVCVIGEGGELLLAGLAASCGFGWIDGGDRAPPSLIVERAVSYAADLMLQELDVEARRERLKLVLALCGLAERLRERIDALEAADRWRVAMAIEALVSPQVLCVSGPLPDACWEQIEALVDELKMCVVVAGDAPLGRARRVSLV